MKISSPAPTNTTFITNTTWGDTVASGRRSHGRGEIKELMIQDVTASSTKKIRWTRYPNSLKRAQYIFCKYTRWGVSRIQLITWTPHRSASIQQEARQKTYGLYSEPLRTSHPPKRSAYSLILQS